jgi:hypothetical protein
VSEPINLTQLRAKAKAAYGTRRRPASPTEVLALIDTAEAAIAYIGWVDEPQPYETAKEMNDRLRETLQRFEGA